MEEKPNNRSKWLALVSIPTQMGAIIYLFYFIGSWLDENHPSATVYYSKILGMIGICLAIYNVIRQLNEINKTE